jgi:transposase
MHPNSRQPRQQRRVHSVEFKVAVIQQCQQPGASVAAVALTHGLNVNLVRKWLVGRGLKRSGIAPPRAAAPSARSMPAAPLSPPSLQFVPVELGSAVERGRDATPAAAEPTPASHDAADIRIELRRGAAMLNVRWPSAQAACCAAWLRELAAAVLK